MWKFMPCLFLCLTFLVCFSPTQVAAMSVNKKVIVIDAGHGGWDPGKLGKNEERESDINLAITMELQRLLELGGAIVFLTRAGDDALADTKNADLTARSAMPGDMQADIFISIHQNAFPQSNVRGAQTFYYGSEESEKLACAIQDRVRDFLDEENRKEAKVNKDYLLLRESETTAVIVECGFMTNDEERALLTNEEYQRKVAWAIYLGIIDYFEKT